MSVSTALYVAAGGAVGALARFGVVSLVGAWAQTAGSSFPYGTMVVNVLGSFILGALVEFAAQTWSWTPEIRSFLVIGILGSFTTFSTFSLDVITLLQRSEILQAALYAGLSVALSLAALYTGMLIFRTILS